MSIYVNDFFSEGDRVLVHRQFGDNFSCDFIGHVQKNTRGIVIVRDIDGDEWEVEEQQLERW